MHAHYEDHGKLPEIVCFMKERAATDPVFKHPCVLYLHRKP